MEEQITITITPENVNELKKVQLDKASQKKLLIADLKMLIAQAQADVDRYKSELAIIRNS